MLYSMAVSIAEDIIGDFFVAASMSHQELSELLGEDVLSLEESIRIEDAYMDRAVRL